MTAGGAAQAAPSTGSVDPVVLPAGEVVTPPIDCSPTAAHPRPVIVLPGADGITSDTADQWSTVTSALRESGTCTLVFQGGVVDGRRWAGDIPDEAAQLAEFVTSVKDATGADTVDLVAHSAGTVVSNYYLKVLGGAQDVMHAVFLAPEGRDCDGAGFLTTYGIHNPPVTPLQALQALPFLSPLLGHASPSWRSPCNWHPARKCTRRCSVTGRSPNPVSAIPCWPLQTTRSRHPRGRARSSPSRV
ncbi:esterase/lipase family protein [Rhodococcus opacus]|uniref:esterase/lipase family protein n=1 Tax=Rhodococcus opacus TaxID=37919 RepID=UPI002235C876|nr:hypothetical protein [Rhodococcus opacus]UZG55429.1 hypothetical protein ONE62_36370 [Rhodococcus opacus]